MQYQVKTYFVTSSKKIIVLCNETFSWQRHLWHLTWQIQMLCFVGNSFCTSAHCMLHEPQAGTWSVVEDFFLLKEKGKMSRAYNVLQIHALHIQPFWNVRCYEVVLKPLIKWKTVLLSLCKYLFFFGWNGPIASTVSLCCTFESLNLFCSFLSDFLHLVQVCIELNWPNLHATDQVSHR